MRIAKPTLLLSALAVMTLAGPALADPVVKGTPSIPASAPRPELKLDLSSPAATWLWATPRGNVASLAPITLPALPRPSLWSSGGGGPLRISGGVVLGIGLAILFGAGVTGIVAAAEASRLGDHCPNKVCVEGTTGGDSLETARDAAYAADWLVGVGGPVTASGTILLLYSAVVERNNYGSLVRPSPAFRASASGGGLTFQF